MKDHPAPETLVGRSFHTTAEDYAESLNLNSRVVVPYGHFNNCLKSQETTPLEPDALEDKYYAPGVGNVLTVDLVTGERDELISITTDLILGPESLRCWHAGLHLQVTRKAQCS